MKMNAYTFDEINVGMQVSFEKRITSQMEDSFRELTEDVNPLHQDDDFAKEIGGERFKGHVAFGMLTASLLSTVAGVYMPGKYSLIHSVDGLSFLKPVYAQDVLKISAEVIDTVDELKLIILKVAIRNQNNVLVARAKMKVLVMK